MAQTGLQKFIVRTLLFQFVIFVGIFQLINLDTSSKSFFDNYSDGKDRLKIGNDYGIENLMKSDDKYIVMYKFYLIIMIACASFSVLLNKGLFKLITALLFGVVSFVTYNPFLPSNVISSNNLYGLRHELIISLGIVIGIVLNMFLPEYIEIQIRDKEEKEEIKGKEIEMTEVKEKKKKQSSSNKKGSKKI